MKTLRRILLIGLCLAMLLAIAACGKKDDGTTESPAGNSETPGTPEVSTPADDGADSSFESYSIGFTNLCAGIWSIDYGQKTLETYIQPHGIEILSMSANFSADQMMKDVQNMVQAGCRGISIIPVMPTMLPSVSDLCQDNEVYFAGFSQLIQGDNLELLLDNPYYCGSIGMNALESGQHIAKIALEDGKTKAVIVAGAIGNTNHDNLIAGFTEVFEAGGGEVLGVGHSETEAAQRADDLIAAYGSEIDCAFGMSMDFADSLIMALENYGLEPGKDVKVYAAELDGNGAERVKAGIMGGLSQNCIDASFSAALVMNAIDGKRLVDENGDPIWADNMLLFEVNADNADNYLKYWVNDFPLTTEGFDQLLYRCNPDISYESFMDYCANYNYEFVMGLRGE